MSILDLTNREDTRRFLHVAVPGIAAVLVTIGVMASDIAALVASTVLLVFDAALSRINTTDRVRQWFYPVTALVALAALGVGHWVDLEAAQWFAIIPILLGGSVAAAKTPSGSEDAARPQ